MMTLLILIGAVAGMWLLGAALATLFLGRRVWRPSGSGGWLTGRAELIGLGLVLGIAGTSYALYLWGLCGGPLDRRVSFCLMLLGIVAGLSAWTFSRSTQTATESSATPEEIAWIKFAALLIGLLFVSQMTQTLFTPQRLWDERAIFGLKSIVLFQDGQLRSPDLLHDDFVQYHPRYPLLIPLAETHIYALLGRVDDRWSKMLFPLMSLGLSLTFAGALQRQVRAADAWLWALVLSTAPLLAFNDYGFLSGQADAPVACYHGVALLYLWSWLRARREVQSAESRPLILAGVAAAMTLFTKDEGIALLIIDTTLLALTATIAAWPHTQKKFIAIRFALIATAIFVATVMMVTVPWFLYRGRLPSTTEMQYSGRLNWATLSAGTVTLAWSLPHLLRRIFVEVTEMSFAWWGMLLSAISRFRRAFHAEQLLPLGDVIGALTALLVAGMIAPTPVEEHIGGSSHRFLMQLTPAAILFIAGAWSRPIVMDDKNAKD